MNEGVTKCPECGVPVRQTGGRGRARIYCSDSCRKAAHRSRSTSWEWLQENRPQASSWSNEGLPNLAEEVPAPSGSQVDQVAESIIVASALVAEFRRHAVASTSPRLAARCGRVADALDAALATEFAEVFK